MGDKADIIRSLQASLRNAENTFGPESRQYMTCKSILDEYTATTAFEAMRIGQSGRSDHNGAASNHTSGRGKQPEEGAMQMDSQ
ncbi:hypothetical protein M011DRAFT_32469 [Sporormia fimetaria CBS 119925]|uniref:Uncharacterized protein n=1 Tax=Sporormia fimetaria CBS 119925 TaxID=1340428 RepID=A0A6A6VF03_9PLEO|nr:hypothetical protein M011DRAFT_32469 [Sporormia fimetaria CBS 119925]